MDTHNPSAPTVGLALVFATLVGTALLWLAANGKAAIVIPTVFG